MIHLHLLADDGPDPYKEAAHRRRRSHADLKVNIRVVLLQGVCTPIHTKFGFQPHALRLGIFGNV